MKKIKDLPIEDQARIEKIRLECSCIQDRIDAILEKKIKLEEKLYLEQDLYYRKADEIARILHG